MCSASAPSTTWSLLLKSRRRQELRSRECLIVVDRHRVYRVVIRFCSSSFKHPLPPFFQYKALCSSRDLLFPWAQALSSSSSSSLSSSLHPLQASMLHLPIFALHVPHATASPTQVKLVPSSRPRTQPPASQHLVKSQVRCFTPYKQTVYPYSSDAFNRYKKISIQGTPCAVPSGRHGL